MIGIAGCGALGSHIAQFIATPEMKLALFDFDTVNEQNVLTGTSVYSKNHVGMNKARVLSGLLYTRLGSIATPVIREVTNASAFRDCSLLIDTFDNIEARFHTCGLGIPTLHVGVSPQMIGAIEWDETYNLPEGTGQEPNIICTHQVGRDLILLTSVAASTIIRGFLENGIRLSVVVNNKLEIIR
jgi:hypothetical protein